MGGWNGTGGCDGLLGRVVGPGVKEVGMWSQRQTQPPIHTCTQQVPHLCQEVCEPDAVQLGRRNADGVAVVREAFERALKYLLAARGGRGRGGGEGSAPGQDVPLNSQPASAGLASSSGFHGVTGSRMAASTE